jgi:hypothetical protein
MREERPDGADIMDEPHTQELPDLAGRQTGSDQPHRHRRADARMPRGWAALAWIVGGIVLFGVLLRIALTENVSSDPANNVLQAWDLVHGNLLLHGWILGDVTFYTFELPLLGVIELFFGVHTIALHVALALVYLLVTVFAAAIAVTGSRGPARVARAAVVVAVLAAPIFQTTDSWIPISLPDHTGTAVFLLLPFLMIDRADRDNRASAARYTAPLLCLILAAGQLSDVTVRFVAVPAIVIVCGYQMLVARKLVNRDGVNLLAALVSVALSLVVRKAMLHFHSYVMVAPQMKIAPVHLWLHHARITWLDIREVYGAVAYYQHPQVVVDGALVFGWICLIATAVGMLRVLWRWRTASRAEQVLLIAIVGNLAIYTLSALVGPNSPHDIIAIVPMGAVLAARALIPERFTSRVALLAGCGLAAVAALLPMCLSAARPLTRPTSAATLSVWLSAHGLDYGLGNYWNASGVTVQSGNVVQVRTIQTTGREMTTYAWESDSAWYDPAKHYANFVIVSPNSNPTLAGVLRNFGKPATTDLVSGDKILIYNKNLLPLVKEAKPTRTS